MKNFIIDLYIRIKKAHTYRELYKYRNNGILNVGNFTYGVENITIDEYKGSEAKVFIGKYCSLAKNLRIITGGIHPVDRVSTFPFKARLNLKGKFENGMPYTNGEINIGNDVWIGTGVTILSGVKIGDGAIIATNATITKDIPPYAIVAGIPAKVLKYRFENAIIEKMLLLKWWDWEEDKILNNVDFLTNLANSEAIEKMLKN